MGSKIRLLAVPILFAACSSQGLIRTTVNEVTTASSEELAPLATEASPQVQAHLERLLRALGSEEYHEREAATHALIEAGPQAELVLERAVASRDPEVVARARFILRPDASDPSSSPAFPPYPLVGVIPTLVANPPDGTDTNDFTAIRVIQESARTEYYDLRDQTFNTFRGGAGASPDRQPTPPDREDQQRQH